MTRVKRGYVARRRRNNLKKVIKGSKRARSKLTRTGQQQAMKTLSYSHRDRGIRKRNFRNLWITRINAAARIQKICYSQMMFQLRRVNILLNRKMLSQIFLLDNNSADFISTVVKAEMVMFSLL